MYIFLTYLAIYLGSAGLAIAVLTAIGVVNSSRSVDINAYAKEVDRGRIVGGDDL
ncbi:hypothetical protein KXR83_05590 [Williamsia muralis]|uniref:hypothetical protein n=1 Tax=Williamsia marianensis TaxID=85044 RepID=UPI003F17ADD4